ncbi:hypothetical protein Lspi_0370 [Legionella spiritensis]|uniref:Uncharacterized protein n=2 Tax=Legionella spiritensis TaxID=452 RepID=A0A0W0Z9C7_LEGSP|nr:hypothetical protein Lspi_0370 [Legionella spiritensis]SNV43703.1 Uncharacterised protein [Legionella spiritensis]
MQDVFIMKSPKDMKDQLQQYMDTIKNNSPQKGLFFKEIPSPDFIENLERSLRLSRFMSPQELLQGLQFIETLIVKKSDFFRGEDATFRAVLSRQYNRRILKDISAPSRAIPKEPHYIKSDAVLYRNLIRMHDTLLGRYEVARLHMNGEIPFSSVDYKPDVIQSTQAFRDLENTSKSSELPDKSNIILDVRRKGVTFYGSVIHPHEPEIKDDPYIIQTIERYVARQFYDKDDIVHFVDERIDEDGSRANKIYHFGGQFLEGIFLSELTNNVEFTETGQRGLERGMVKGHINWTKDPKTKEIYAKVNINILTCVYADPINKDDPQRFYAIGSDGSSLTMISEEELEQVNKRCSDEIAGKTENNVVPLCTMSARISLPVDRSTGKHFLRADKFTISFNTPDLRSSKEDHLYEHSRFRAIK